MAFLCVDYWISNWHAHAEPLWSLGFVCFLLFSGAVLFVTCWLVMPDIEGTEAIDLAAYHAANRRKYLSTLLIYFCLSVSVNQLLPGFQSPTMLLISGASIALLVSAWIWKSHAVQVGAVVGIYLLGIRSLFFFGKKQLAERIAESEAPARYRHLTLRTAVARYAVHALVIVGVAVWLPLVGEGLAKQTGRSSSPPRPRSPNWSFRSRR